MSKDTTSDSRIRMLDTIQHYGFTQPDDLAVIDCPRKQNLLDIEPRAYSWTELNQAINTYAHIFSLLRLKPKSIIAIQLPNVTEALVIKFAAQKLGMIPTLLPLHWQQQELNNSLAQLAPDMLIGFHTQQHQTSIASNLDNLMNFAADQMSVRQVAAIADPSTRLDGVLNLTFMAQNIDQFDEGYEGDRAHSEAFKLHQPGDISLIAWQITNSPKAKPRFFSELQIHSSAVTFVKAADIKDKPEFMSTFAPSTLAGRLAAWDISIMLGSRLSLHLPTTLKNLLADIEIAKPDYVSIPAHLAGFIEPVFQKHKEITPICVYHHASSANIDASQLDRIDLYPLSDIAHITRKAGIGIPTSLTTEQLTTPYPELDPDLLNLSLKTSDGTLSEITCKGLMVPDNRHLSWREDIDHLIYDTDELDGLNTHILINEESHEHILPSPLEQDTWQWGSVQLRFKLLDQIMVSLDTIKEAAHYIATEGMMNYLALAIVPENNQSPPTLEELYQALDEAHIPHAGYPRALTYLREIPHQADGSPDRQALSDKEKRSHRILHDVDELQQKQSVG